MQIILFYFKCDWGSYKWQQIKLAFELESDLGQSGCWHFTNCEGILNFSKALSQGKNKSAKLTISLLASSHNNNIQASKITFFKSI